jgi:hypothetical protein
MGVARKNRKVSRKMIKALIVKTVVSSQYEWEELYDDPTNPPNVPGAVMEYYKGNIRWVVHIETLEQIEELLDAHLELYQDCNYYFPDIQCIVRVWG